MSKKLIILGEYNPSWETHILTNESISHSLQYLNASMDIEWLPSEEAKPAVIKKAAGLWVATGAPYKNIKNVLESIRFAREQKLPCLGTCQGFQHIMLEYAQAFLNINSSGHEEYDRTIDKPFISALTCSLKGQEGDIDLVEASMISNIYGVNRVRERFYCSYGVNPAYRDLINKEYLRISGTDSLNKIRIVEYSNHPFMIGTLFVPQAKSQIRKPHPLINAFLQTML
jgi:CTP synthase (UTP-ammonia lyase)